MFKFFKPKILPKDKCYKDSSYPFSEQWDKKVNELLDNGEVKSIDEYYIKISDDKYLYMIWIGNYPSVYGNIRYLDIEFVEYTFRRSLSIFTTERLKNFIKDHPLNPDNQKKKVLEMAGCL